jgi:hypothetical protein
MELIRNILANHPKGLTPQQLREHIKKHHAAFYGTEAHRRNVEKGHYQDLDHALLAQIYIAARSGVGLSVDRSTKPIKLSLGSRPTEGESPPDESIDSENLEKLEAGVGTLYILGTHLYTKSGEEIFKIGITTGPIEARLTQLYTTGVPFKFRVVKVFDTSNFYELEQSLHKLLDPYRINRSREFFTEKCLPFVEQICAIHKDIQGAR